MPLTSEFTEQNGHAWVSLSGSLSTHSETWVGQFVARSVRCLCVKCVCVCARACVCVCAEQVDRPGTH